MNTTAKQLMSQFNEPMNAAILWDAENISWRDISLVMHLIASLGFIVKNIALADWTSPKNSKWAQIALSYDIELRQVDIKKTGTNAVDKALKSDLSAMCQSSDFDAFVVVGTDYGYGQSVFPVLRNDKLYIACGADDTCVGYRCKADMFINLTKAKIETNIRYIRTWQETLEVIFLLRWAISSVADGDGWASLSGVGAYIAERGFDIKAHFGFNKLSELLMYLGCYCFKGLDGDSPMVTERMRWRGQSG